VKAFPAVLARQASQIQYHRVPHRLQNQTQKVNPSQVPQKVNLLAVLQALNQRAFRAVVQARAFLILSRQAVHPLVYRIQYHLALRVLLSQYLQAAHHLQRVNL